MVPIRLLFEVIVEGNTMNDVTFIKKRGEMERIRIKITIFAEKIK